MFYVGWLLRATSVANGQATRANENERNQRRKGREGIREREREDNTITMREQ